MMIAREKIFGAVAAATFGSVGPISQFDGCTQSGFGCELGKHSIELYMQTKSVYVRL